MKENYLKIVLINFLLTQNSLAIVPIKPVVSIVKVKRIQINRLKITQRRGGQNRFRDNNSRLLRNYRYAGKSIYIRKIAPKLSLKYIKPIKFNKYGYPDFSKYSKINIKTSKLTGNHLKDVQTVEKIAKQKYPNWKKRVGYTWHHHQDGKTMQYVPTDLHSAIPHSGGASRLRVLRNNK